MQGTDGHLAQITYDETTKAESRAYVHPDALGTASAVTDDNKVVTRFDNEPFGKRVQPSGAPFTGDFPNVQVGFTGHSMDDDLGLVNMKGRIFDPSQRRFLSPDPLVSRPLNAQSYNRYSYVYNDPLSFTDLSGFEGTGSGDNYCATHPNDPPCAPPPPGGAGPGSGGSWLGNPNAGTCGPGTNHPCPTPAPAGLRQALASKYHVVIVPVVAGTGDKWNPHSFEGQVQKALFGSAPEIDYAASTQPSPEVVRAVAGFVPGLNSALVFANAKSTTFDKALAVGTDVLSVVGVGTVIKLGAKGVVLGKGLVLGTKVAEGVVIAEDLVVAAVPELKISAGAYPDLAENISNAMKSGRPSLLTHGGDRMANRAAALTDVPNIPGLTRDEYPFASALEGGAGSWVGHIPASQQNAQGALIKNFLVQNGITPGQQYRVIIAP